MTGPDLEYIKTLVKSGIMIGPVLELGAGYGGNTCRELIEQADLEYEATDIFPSEGVKYVADFTDQKNVSKVFGDQRYGTVLCLNILEHTFDPAAILDNSLSLIRKGGRLVVITPAVWTLHNFPIDCSRLLPNWYEEYAKSRQCVLIREYFYYVGYGSVANFVDKDGNYQFPLPCPIGSFKYWWSRFIHKAFNTSGRGMAFPSHIAIGCVFANEDRP